jgi:hypothetical protein
MFHLRNLKQFVRRSLSGTAQVLKQPVLVAAERFCVSSSPAIADNLLLSFYEFDESLKTVHKTSGNLCDHGAVTALASIRNQ